MTSSSAPQPASQWQQQTEQIELWVWHGSSDLLPCRPVCHKVHMQLIYSMYVWKQRETLSAFEWSAVLKFTLNCPSVHTTLIYVPALVKAGVFGASNMCAGAHVCLLPGPGCELGMNEWEGHKHLRKQEHTDTLSELYLWSWLRWGKHHARPSSGRGEGPTTTLGLLKPPPPPPGWVPGGTRADGMQAWV